MEEKLANIRVEILERREEDGVAWYVVVLDDKGFLIRRIEKTNSRELAERTRRWAEEVLVERIKENIKMLREQSQIEPKTIYDEFIKTYATNALHHQNCQCFLGYHCSCCYSDALEKLIQKYNISTITIEEPPTPSGYGALTYIFNFKDGQVEYCCYTDSKLTSKRKGSSLAEIMEDWYYPFDVLRYILEAILQNTISDVSDVLFGRGRVSISVS